VIDPFELVRAEEMIIGYSARWFDEPYEVLGVEQEFQTALVEPDSDIESNFFDLGGKLDCVARHIPTGDTVLIESKTTSEDISEGSPYWLRTLMSSQLSTYLVGMRQLCYEPTRIVYDVLARPAQRPYEATPIELRKYTKPTKKEPEPRLYANQRETDETPEDFRQRIRAAISENPEKYYRRGGAVRLASEEREAAFDAWQIAENITEGRFKNSFPRNPDACAGVGQGVCTFLPVCAGMAAIDDPFRYRRVENVHQELTIKSRSLPLLTNSQMATFRKCQRLHHFRYDLGVRSLTTTEPQRAGTLVHRGLEGWWLAKKNGLDERTCVWQAMAMMSREPPSPAYLPEEAVA
jgi:hypothetical protein